MSESIARCAVIACYVVTYSAGKARTSKRLSPSKNVLADMKLDEFIERGLSCSSESESVEEDGQLEAAAGTKHIMKKHQCNWSVMCLYCLVVVLMAPVFIKATHECCDEVLQRELEEGGRERRERVQGREEDVEFRSYNVISQYWEASYVGWLDKRWPGCQNWVDSFPLFFSACHHKVKILKELCLNDWLQLIPSFTSFFRRMTVSCWR